jgi:Flp pilus assembly protein TadD
MNDMTTHRADDAQVKTEVAQGAILRAIGLDRDTLRLGLDVARNHMQRGAYHDAFQAYVTMVICDPMEVDFQIGLANCALYISENELALQSASAVISLAPEDPRGYFLSARACLAIGAFYDAREDLQEAIKLATEQNDEVVLSQAMRVMNGIQALDS